MNSVNNIVKTLKASGFKNTKIRESLIEVLLKHQTPLSITEILSELSKSDLTPNKTTVYREIEFLRNQQILQEIEFGDGKKRYEISENHHHHIICLNCGLIKDLPMEQELNEEENKIIKNLGFKPIGHSLEFFGLCSKCQ
jgi:Fe2+ or Zn2+ uptake regulation protein